jgi:uncharacterized protein (TIGR00252 family)
MTLQSYDHGRKAEAAARDFLERKGCKLVASNWRTRWCEIDIIAERSGTVYFCEVKYRQAAGQGSGIEYVTPKKVRQMTFAADMWLATHNWQGDCQLCVIEVSGPQYRVSTVITDVR